MSARSSAAIAALAAVILALAGCAPTSGSNPAQTDAGHNSARHRHSGVVVRDAAVAQTPPVTAEVLDSLPEARYDAVIPALDASAPRNPSDASLVILTLRADVALYGADRDQPAARLSARDFLGQPTTVLAFPARRDGWQLLLTPARRQLPSRSSGAASAQSYAWMRADPLAPSSPVTARIEVSVEARSVTISGPSGTLTFPAGIGTDTTPTPTDVTGYIEARYLDPAQGQAVHRIQLTSLHATASDEPYGGRDGGLIAIHFGSGGSHGCIRVAAEAVAAIDALPVGTPVWIH